jgi:RNA polymerase sigma factor (sigma-70 family)
MSTVFDAKPQAAQNLADISSKLEFQKQLQSVTNRIHATSNVDEIMLELGQDICSLLGADRLTIYALSDDRSSIVSKVKTGLTSFKDLKLPINDQSIAGFVAQSRNMINIRDVYDENELRGLSPQLRFLKEVDKRTGYRTKQMLVGPVVEVATSELVGVVQAINTKSGHPFSPLAEEGMANLCETLAIAFKQRQKQQTAVRGRYDALVANAVLSAEEMELALRSARRKGLDLEAVLAAEGRDPDTGGVFAFGGVLLQRFGRGRSMVFAGEASWRWRMLQSSTDRSYEFFWRQAARFDPSRGTPEAWLCTMARTRALDRLRKRTSRREEPEQETPGAVPAPRNEEALAARRALDALPPEQKRALELAYYEGLTQSEIAKRLEEPLGTVKTRIRSAMIRLRGVLGPAT